MSVDLSRFEYIINSDEPHTLIPLKMTQGGGQPIDLFSNRPDILYSLIAAHPRIWWWRDAPGCVLKPQNGRNVEVDLWLCESGRFAVSYCDNTLGGLSWLVDPERLRTDHVSYSDYTPAGGNEIPVLSIAAVPWQFAWATVAELFVTGERNDELVWLAHEAFEPRFGLRVFGEP